jgi:hypothetical protein
MHCHDVKSTYAAKDRVCFDKCLVNIPKVEVGMFG